MAALGYLAKLKWGLGLAFGAHFLYGFSIKMFLTAFFTALKGLSFGER